MKTNQEVLQRIVQECWDNPSFITKLKNNPVESIENLTGQKVKLPEGVDGIVVVDQTDQTKVFVNIPAEPNLDNMELSESEMELVSGGSAVNIIKHGRVNWGPIICELPYIPPGGYPRGPRTPSPTVPNPIPEKG